MNVTVTVTEMVMEQVTKTVERKGKRTVDGKVVCVNGDKLVMTGKDGKEHSHTFTRDVIVTLDSKACKAADLKAGMKIRVTTSGADMQLADQIEAIDTNLAFATFNRLDGKVVSISGNNLVMANAAGSDEHTCNLALDAMLSCDGKICKAADLKPGMKIRVTTNIDAPQATTQVEAIDKNLAFATFNRQDGKVVGITGNQLVMMAKEASSENTCTLSADAKIT